MPTPIPYHELHGFFADEGEYGQLCDIIVPKTNREVWDDVLRVISKHPHEFMWCHPESHDPEYEAAPIPEAARLLSQGESDEGSWPALGFSVGDLELRVVFFCESWFEADFRRNEMNPERYLRLCGFVAALGDATGRNVFITPESDLGAAEVLYESSRKRFRRPRRGCQSDGLVRERFKREIKDILYPFRSAADLTEHGLSACLKRLEHLLDSHDELTLQDELSIEDLRDARWLWSLITTIVEPAPGSGAGRYRKSYEQELVRIARNKCQEP